MMLARFKRQDPYEDWQRKQNYLSDVHHLEKQGTCIYRTRTDHDRYIGFYHAQATIRAKGCLIQLESVEHFGTTVAIIGLEEHVNAIANTLRDFQRMDTKTVPDCDITKFRTIGGIEKAAGKNT
jgi:hypothetical protein